MMCMDKSFKINIQYTIKKKKELFIFIEWCPFSLTDQSGLIQSPKLKKAPKPPLTLANKLISKGKTSNQNVVGISIQYCFALQVV